MQWLAWGSQWKLKVAFMKRGGNKGKAERVYSLREFKSLKCM